MTHDADESTRERHERLAFQGKNSAGVQVRRTPPGVHPTVFPRGSGRGRKVHLAAADPHAQSAVVDVREVEVDGKVLRREERVDIRGAYNRRKVTSSPIPWRTDDSYELGQARKWRYVCEEEGCTFYAANEKPVKKHEAKTGHVVPRGGE